MSLQQPDDSQSSFKSHRKTRFTIDAILDNTAPARRAMAEEMATTSFVVPSDDALASATERHDSGAALPRPLFSGADRQQPDVERRPTRIYRVDGDMERIDEGSVADAETRQGSAQCNSLIAQTAAAFHRRHQHRVAQLRSFSELFLAQYQRQLRNHFRHHSADHPSTIPASMPPPPPSRSLPGLDDHRPPPDDVRSSSNALQWSSVDHGSPLPTSTSTSVQSRTSRLCSVSGHRSAVDLQSLTLTQSGCFVDGSTDYRATTPLMSTASISAYGDNETHNECSIVDYSGDENRRKWTASNNTGIERHTSYTFNKIIADAK